MNAPESFQTARLLLRKPAPADAEAIFRRYSSDPEVTRYLSWPNHNSVRDTQAFIAWSDSEWQRWPAGGGNQAELPPAGLLGGAILLRFG